MILDKKAFQPLLPNLQGSRLTSKPLDKIALTLITSLQLIASTKAEKSGFCSFLLSIKKVPHSKIIANTRITPFLTPAFISSALIISGNSLYNGQAYERKIRR